MTIHVSVSPEVIVEIQRLLLKSVVYELSSLDTQKFRVTNLQRDAFSPLIISQAFSGVQIEDRTFNSDSRVNLRTFSSTPWHGILVILYNISTRMNLPRTCSSIVLM